MSQNYDEFETRQEYELKKARRESMSREFMVAIIRNDGCSWDNQLIDLDTARRHARSAVVRADALIKILDGKD